MKTPYDIAEHLGKLTIEIDHLVKRIDEAEISAVNLREDYTRAYASAFLQSGGNLEERKQISLLKTQQARLDAELAEQTVRGLKRQEQTLRLRVDVGRTISATLRSEISLAGSGPHD